jgi:hypothetical protein
VTEAEQQLSGTGKRKEASKLDEKFTLSVVVIT